MKQLIILFSILIGAQSATAQRSINPDEHNFIATMLTECKKGTFTFERTEFVRFRQIQEIYGHSIRKPRKFKIFHAPSENPIIEELKLVNEGYCRGIHIGVPILPGTQAILIYDDENPSLILFNSKNKAEFYHSAKKYKSKIEVWKHQKYFKNSTAKVEIYEGGNENCDRDIERLKLAEFEVNGKFQFNPLPYHIYEIFVTRNDTIVNIHFEKAYLNHASRTQIIQTSKEETFQQNSRCN